MKKIFIVLLVVVIAVIGLYVSHKRLPSENVAATVPQNSQPTQSSQSSQTATKSCYVRTVAATPQAPYAISERIELIHDDTNAVTGTKSGTQSGPDMTNGYTGTLSGTRDGELLTLLYSYTIEGSQQKEQEIYVMPFKVPELVKRRYPLVEKNGILVPDTTKPYTSETYDWVKCV